MPQKILVSLARRGAFFYEKMGVEERNLRSKWVDEMRQGGSEWGLVGLWFSVVMGLDYSHTHTHTHTYKYKLPMWVANGYGSQVIN